MHPQELKLTCKNKISKHIVCVIQVMWFLHNVNMSNRSKGHIEEAVNFSYWYLFRIEVSNRYTYVLPAVYKDANNCTCKVSSSCTKSTYAMVKGQTEGSQSLLLSKFRDWHVGHWFQVELAAALRRARGWPRSLVPRRAVSWLRSLVPR